MKRLKLWIAIFVQLLQEIGKLCLLDKGHVTFTQNIVYQASLPSSCGHHKLCLRYNYNNKVVHFSFW